MASDPPKPTTLNCPSCGSLMNAPDKQGVSECSYCHTKIIVPQTATQKEQQSISKYVQLCTAAKAARNQEEVIKYCNSILEIDPSNRDAWIDKAFAAAWLTTENNDRFLEGMSYLKQVEQLYPNDADVKEAQKRLENMQVDWYKYMARENLERATRSIGTGYFNQYTIAGMAYYLKALQVIPDNIELLKLVGRTAKAGNMVGIGWSGEVYVALERLRRFEDKQTALQRLSARQAELQKLKNELASLKKKGGFFAKLDIEDVQKDIKRVTEEINRLQELIN